MLEIDLLLVGDATDGPVEEIIEVEDLDRTLRLFGFYEIVETSVLSGTTGFNLPFVPWGNECVPLRLDSDGFLIPRQMFELTVSGSVLTWTAPGSEFTLYLRAPTVPGPTSLIKGIFAAGNSDARIHVVRLGGEHASATSGVHTIRSLYPGARHNGTTVTISTGGTVAVVPKAGMGRSRTYTPSSDIHLSLLLRNDAAMGYQSVLLTGRLASNALTIPVGTLTLTGGTSGQMTAALFQQFVEEHDLTGVDVICPVGLTTQQVSGTGVLTTLSENDYPTLLVAQAPVAASGSALSGAVNTSRYLCSVGFRTLYDTSDPRERLDDAAPMVAAIIAADRFGLTFAPLPFAPPTPRFDTAGVNAMTAARHTVATRSISKGWALWHVLTGDPNWTVSTFRAWQEVVRPVIEIMEQQMGRSSISLDSIDQFLADAFLEVTGSRVVDWNVEVVGDVIYTDIFFRPYGEVQTIKGQLLLQSATSNDLR